MKKIILVAVAALLVAAMPVAAEVNTYYKPGTVTAQAGVGFGYSYLFFGGLELAGGVDVGVAQVSFAPVVPIDFGISGRVGLVFPGSLDAGAYGTAHYSWKALGTGLDWVNRIESYLGIGLRVLGGFGLDAYGGNSYHFDKNLAVFLENGYYTSVVGLNFTF